MSYVEGFVVPVPKRNLAAYKKMAKWVCRIFIKYGALQFFEGVAHDLKVPEGCGISFPKGIRSKPGETVAFAFIIYKSKAHRDAVVRRVTGDPAMATPPRKMPFDVKRMLYGGFKAIVEG